MRLTADGNLRPCLMSDQEIPLLQALRSGESIEAAYQKAVESKPKNHELNHNLRPDGRFMTQIGG
jgi:cyclic pyranopterin phosphate synthase